MFTNQTYQIIDKGTSQLIKYKVLGKDGVRTLDLVEIFESEKFKNFESSDQILLCYMLNEKFGKKNFYNFSYYIISLLFAFILIVSNISASKICNFYGYNLDAGTLFFPLLYILNDVLGEVYGFYASRIAIYTALILNSLFVLLLYVVVQLPQSPIWHDQRAFESVFDIAPRVVCGSLTSYFIGELLNSFVLTSSKKKFKGKYFGIRALFSTSLGAFLESAMFSTIVFKGRMSSDYILEMIFALTAIKVVYELLSLPLTIKLVHLLQKSYSKFIISNLKTQ